MTECCFVFVQACNSDQYMAVPRKDMMRMLKQKGQSSHIIGLILSGLLKILSRRSKDVSTCHNFSCLRLCSVHFWSEANLTSFWLFKNEGIELSYFLCRIFAGQRWPHTTAGWGDDPRCDPWPPQVCPSLSMGPPFRSGPRHPDLSQWGTNTAPHRAPRPPAEDTDLLCLHQMWQGVLGRLSLRPCPFHVSGCLPHRWHWIRCRAHYSSCHDIQLNCLLYKISLILFFVYFLYRGWWFYCQSFKSIVYVRVWRTSL